jgi:hypothetical protein
MHDFKIQSLGLFFLVLALCGTFEEAYTLNEESFLWIPLPKMGGDSPGPAVSALRRNTRTVTPSAARSTDNAV